MISQRQRWVLVEVCKSIKMIEDKTDEVFPIKIGRVSYPFEGDLVANVNGEHCLTLNGELFDVDGLGYARLFLVDDVFLLLNDVLDSL